MASETGAWFIPKGLPGAAPRKSPTQERLLTALARAFHWQQLTDSDRYASITDLAEALHVDRSYVGSILRLTLLAPDITEAIPRCPKTETGGKLRGQHDLPESEDWNIRSGWSIVVVRAEDLGR